MENNRRSFLSFLVGAAGVGGTLKVMRVRKPDPPVVLAEFEVGDLLTPERMNELVRAINSVIAGTIVGPGRPL